MAKQIIYACDECCSQKREANHWWVLLKIDHPSSRLIVENLQPDLDYSLDFQIACGEGCVTKMVSRYLRTGDPSGKAEQKSEI